jgi:predicted dehydrogenase
MRSRIDVERVRIGIVGCGAAAQVMHLPSLRLLDDLFTVTALADVGPQVAESVGALWNVPARHTDWRAMFAGEDVDAVLVACPNAYHAEVALAALEAGRHVLVEKPMCLTLREADALAAAQHASGRVLQVGYMRRHAPALTEAARLVSALPEIRFARVRDILCLNELLGDQTSRTLRGDGPPAAATARAASDQEVLLREALGDDATPEELHTLFFLLSLVTHDLSAMRDLIGSPLGVLYAARRDARNDRTGPFITAALDFGRFVCHLEAGFDELPRAECDLKVYGTDGTVRVAYGSSFVRNVPVRLTVESSVGRTGTTTTDVLPTWEDPFVAEWRAFHGAIREGEPVRASAQDARLDLELCLDLTRQIARSTRRERA